MIAAELHISPKTVKNHISNILMKLQIENRIQAAVYAVAVGHRLARGAAPSRRVAAAAAAARLGVRALRSRARSPRRRSRRRASGSSEALRGRAARSRARRRRRPSARDEPPLEPQRSASSGAPGVAVGQRALEQRRGRRARGSSSRGPISSSRRRGFAASRASIDGRRAGVMGRAAHLRRTRRPMCRDDPAPCSRHNLPRCGRSGRRGRARGVPVLMSRRSRRSRRAPSLDAAGSRTRSRRRTLAPGVSGAVAVDLATGRDALRAQRRRSRSSPPRTRSCCVTYAALVELGPAYRFRTEVLGEGRQRRERLARARSSSRATATRRSRPAASRRLAAQDARARDPPCDRPRRRRRVVVRRRSADRARLAAVVLRGPSRRRSRRSSSTAAPRRHARARPGARRRGRSSTGCSRAQGVARRGAVAGRAPPGRGHARDASTRSRSRDILRLWTRDSDNFTAELLLKQIGAEVRGKGSSAAGRGGRPARPRGRRRPARRRADRRRLGALAARPLTARELVEHPARCFWNDARAPARSSARSLASPARTGTLEHRLPSTGRPAGVVPARPARRTSPRRSPATSAPLRVRARPERRPGRLGRGARGAGPLRRPPSPRCPRRA